MPLRTILTEIHVYEDQAPLVSGYLQAYASRDPELQRAVNFERYATHVRADPEQMARDLLALDGDLYAFSCYVWNMGYVKRLVDALLTAKPRATRTSMCATAKASRPSPACSGSSPPAGLIRPRCAASVFGAMGL